jgi:hypothetical protein
MSQTSGTSTSGHSCHCTPPIVSLLVRCRKTDPAVASTSLARGRVMNLASLPSKTRLTLPIFLASATAFLAQVPVSV